MASRARSIRRFSASTDRATPPVNHPAHVPLRLRLLDVVGAERYTTWLTPVSSGTFASRTCVLGVTEQNAGMGSADPASLPTMRVPDMMPVLSRGRHRNPRKGACFMELASFVAGERWS